MIKLQNLSYSVFDEETKQEKVILKDVNVEFEKGKITAITGHNGSGKSTLIKIIMGILAPTGGKVLYSDTDITDLTISARANLGLTMAFQQPVKFKGITVYDLLKLSAEKEINRKEACDILSKVGLCAKDYVDREVRNPGYGLFVTDTERVKLIKLLIDTKKEITMITIRPVLENEYDLAYRFIEEARAYQREQGFMQWTDKSPTLFDICKDIIEKSHYCVKVLICECKFTKKPSYEISKSIVRITKS